MHCHIDQRRIIRSPIPIAKSSAFVRGRVSPPRKTLVSESKLEFHKAPSNSIHHISTTQPQQSLYTILHLSIHARHSLGFRQTNPTDRISMNVRLLGHLGINSPDNILIRNEPVVPPTSVLTSPSYTIHNHIRSFPARSRPTQLL